VGSRDGREGSVTVHRDVKIFAGLLDPGQAVTHEILDGRGVWIQVVRGRIRLRDEALAEGDGAASPRGILGVLRGRCRAANNAEREGSGRFARQGSEMSAEPQAGSDSRPARLMFIPVTGGRGLGEYARCLTLARSALRRWPAARVRFVADRSAPAIRDEAIESLLVSGSPTYNSAKIIGWLEEEPPDVVVFDSTGRRSQLDAATRLGTKRIFVASRPSRRRRALLRRTLSRTDEVWLVEPRVERRPLGPWERLQQRLAGGGEVVFVDALFPESDARRRAALTDSLGVGSERYILFAPGGGGWQVDGRPAVEVYAEAARAVGQATGITTVLVTGPLYTGTVEEGPGLIVRRSLSPEQLVDLMYGADLLAIGGGSSVGQAVAMRKVAVASPLGGSDQQDRVARYAAMGLVDACGPDARELARAVERLLADHARRESMLERVRALEARNGLDTALHRLSLLLTNAR
jgi:hypothetical protein